MLKAICNVLILFENLWNENEIWAVILERIRNALGYLFSKVSKNENFKIWVIILKAMCNALEHFLTLKKITFGRSFCKFWRQQNQNFKYHMRRRRFLRSHSAIGVNNVC